MTYTDALAGGERATSAARVCRVSNTFRGVESELPDDRFHGQQDVGDLGTPLLIPLFTPTRHNAAEEKSWFERWPYGVSAAHSIAPAATRLIVLADGRIVSNDTSGTTLGVVGQTPIGQAWLKHPLQAA